MSHISFPIPKACQVKTEDALHLEAWSSFQNAELKDFCLAFHHCSLCSSKSLVNATLAEAKFDIQLLTVILGFVSFQNEIACRPVLDFHNFGNELCADRASLAVSSLCEPCSMTFQGPWPRCSEKAPVGNTRPDVSDMSGLRFCLDSCVVLHWDWP